MATNCIYRTVKLTAGETFVLPPGAEVMGVSDLAAVTSSCGELTVLPNACFKMQWVINVDGEGIIQFTALFTAIMGNHTNAWETDGPSASPIYFTKAGGLGSEVDTGGINLEQQSEMENFIAGSSFSGILTNRKYGFSNQVSNTFNGGFLIQPNPDTGYLLYEFYFQAPLEIGKLFYFEVDSEGNNIMKKARMYATEIDCEEYPTTSVIQSCEDTVVVNPNDPITTTITTAGV